MKERDKYTWADASKDIALLTKLTLAEASAACSELKDLIHPHDAIMPLVALFEAQSPVRMARAIAGLLEQVIE